MRKGFEGLYGLVRDRLLCDPLSGHPFLFCKGQRNRLKVLVWDGSGLWVCEMQEPPLARVSALRWSMSKPVTWNLELLLAVEERERKSDIAHANDANPGVALVNLAF